MKVLNSRKIRVEHAGRQIETEHALLVTMGRYMIITTQITDDGPVEVVATHEYPSGDEAYKEFFEMTKCKLTIKSPGDW